MFCGWGNEKGTFGTLYFCSSCAAGRGRAWIRGPVRGQRGVRFSQHDDQRRAAQADYQHSLTTALYNYTQAATDADW